MIQARIDGHDVLEAAHQESGCDEQHERQRDLTPHQDVARVMASPARRIRAPRFPQGWRDPATAQ